MLENNYMTEEEKKKSFKELFVKIADMPIELILASMKLNQMKSDWLKQQTENFKNGKLVVNNGGYFEIELYEYELKKAMAKYLNS